MDTTPSEPAGLGSLAQAARQKHLKQARGILIFIGVLTILVNGFLLTQVRSEVKRELDKELAGLGLQKGQIGAAQLKQAEDEMVLIAGAVYGVALLLGTVFIVCGVLIHRFPVVATLTSLVLYVGAALVFGVLDPATLLAGVVIKVIIVIALVKAVMAAFAYERERAELPTIEPAV